MYTPKLKKIIVKLLLRSQFKRNHNYLLWCNHFNNSLENDKSVTQLILISPVHLNIHLVLIFNNIIL